MLSGKVKGYEIRKNRDGKKNVLLLQVEISDPYDIQTIELVNDDGIDSRPPKDSRVCIDFIGNAWKIVNAVNDNIEPDATLDYGEKKIYSSASGVIKGFITWLKSGVIRINGKQDFAVRYKELEKAFNQLKSDVNSFVGTFNVHAHTLGGPTPLVPASTSSADITPAKITTILVPDKDGL